MGDKFNNESTDPVIDITSTSENNNDGEDGNFNESLQSGRQKGGNRNRGKYGSGPKDNWSNNSFKSLQFKDTFGKTCSSYLKIESDCVKHTDYTYLNSSITFTISPDVEKVSNQAMVFAVNTMNQAIDGYRITGRREYTEQIRLIAETYVYSWYKCIIATWNGVKNGTSIKSLLFRGHAYIYRLGREGRRLYIDSQGPNVVKSIRFTSEQIENIKVKFSEKFLLAKVAEQFSDLDGNFVIPIYENIMNRMATGAFRLQGKNTLQVMDDADTFSHNTLLSQSTCPLGNCFYNATKSKLLVSVDSTTKIKDFSYIMNKASFVTFDTYIDDYTLTNLSPPKFVTAISLEDRDYLIQDEVKYITGLDCLPNITVYPDNCSPRTGTDLDDKYNKKDFGNLDLFRTSS